MRKIKSTALLGAFVAVASVGVISHEAHGTTIGTNVTTISKEMLPNTVSLQALITPTATSSPNGASITLTISGGASFVPGGSYTISGAGCSAGAPLSGVTTTLTFSNCSVISGDEYPITVVGNPTLSIDVPNTSNSIVLSYSSNLNDGSASVTLQVMPQLSVSASSVTTAYINPSSMTAFTNGFSSATNAVVISNNAFGNNTWSNTISGNETISFSLIGIPSSVTSVSATDSAGNSSTSIAPTSGTGTVTFTLASNSAPFQKASSDTLYFSFFNSGSIQPGTISLSSIVGQVSSYSPVTYVSSSTNFLTFALGGTQIYVPDALASISGNAIQYSYITISMPSSASIASINVLNNPSASCPAPSTSNGLLQSTSTTGVYYIDLGQLAKACTGISPVAWQAGVPLVINVYGQGATPNNITADAYAVFLGHLKRIPVNVLNVSNSSANFSY